MGNDRGKTRFGIRLMVNLCYRPFYIFQLDITVTMLRSYVLLSFEQFQISDPISMTAVVSIVTSALLLTIIAVAITGFAYKERTLCFRDGFKPSFKAKGNSKTRRPKKVYSSRNFHLHHSFTLICMCIYANIQMYYIYRKLLLTVLKLWRT